MSLKKLEAHPCSPTTLGEMGTQCIKMIETITTDTETIITTGTDEETIDVVMTDATIIGMVGDGTEAAVETEMELREGMTVEIETIAETGTETRDE